VSRWGACKATHSSSSLKIHCSHPSWPASVKGAVGKVSQWAGAKKPGKADEEKDKGAAGGGRRVQGDPDIVTVRASDLLTEQEVRRRHWLRSWVECGGSHAVYAQ
jgi:hypothetical protein